MINLIGVVRGMMDSFELYRDAIANDILKKDYNKVCLDSKYLLEALGEEKLSDFELRYNSVELKKGLHALKTMGNQLEEDVIDEELVESSYRKFKENSGKFMKELFEFYVDNEESS